MSTKAVNIELPPLHEGRDGEGGQRAIADHLARFKVVMCGRRYGKTVLGVWLCTKKGLEGKRVWWVAPTYKIANEGWFEIKKLAFQMLDAGLEVEIREGDKAVLFPGGGRVEVRSSDDEGNLRGAGLDYVVLDEAGYHREGAWVDELRHTLIDKRGGALFIGTPRGNNWFAKLYKRALTGSYSNWAAWKKPTWDNPYITDEERVELEAEYIGQQDRYRQEIEADIGASQFLVYPEFNPDVHMWAKPLPHFIAYYGGLDFGGDQIGAHKSAGIVAGIADNDDVICLSEFEESGPNITERQLSWVGEQEARLTVMQRAPFFWAGDRSQQRFIDIMKTFGFHITPNKGGAGSVRAGIDLVSRRLAIRGEGKPRFYYLPNLHKLETHFESYHNYEPRDGDDAQQHINPVKVNDDLDDAIRYMVERKDGSVRGDPQKLYGNLLGAVR